MTDLKKFTEVELVDELLASLAEVGDSKHQSKLKQITHELQTHQIELEMQNRELREAQVELEDSRNRYADLYDFSPVGYLSLDEHGVIEEINLTGAAMLGEERLNILGQPFSRWVAKDQISKLFNHLSEAKDSSEKTSGEIKIRNRAGKIIDLSIESICIKNLTKNEVLCRSIIIDITENNRIKEEILRQARQLKLITDVLPVMIAYVNKDGQHLFANKTYSDWFGVSSSEVVGKSVEDIWGAKNYLVISGYLTNSFSGMSWNVDLKFPGLEQDVKYINAKFIPDIDSDNRVCGVIVLFSDITARLAVEVADRKHLLEAAHISRLSMMGEMATEVAHELNQPLTAISIYSDTCRRMIISGKDNQQDLIKSLGAISTQAKRAGAVIRRIREFVGKKDVKMVSTSINELVGEALQLLEVELRSFKIELDLILADDLPPVSVDRILIEQVILNLTRNALDAMNDIEPSQRILRIRSSEEGDEGVVISIEDSGQGVSTEQIGQIFSPFHTTKVDGTGMGLSICQSIIEAHHGRLQVAQNEHGGATFSFTIPLSEDESDDAG